MQKKILSLVMMLSAIVLCSSCLSNNDDNYTYSDDSAISAFALGNVQFVAGQHAGTGTDSIVSKDFSSVKFRINQLEGRIYNPDSLPVGALADKVLCTVSTYNSGLVGLKSATSDTVRYFSTADTIDFSTPRMFICYSNSGQGYRRYTVSVNVHKQDSAAFVWQKMADVPESVKALEDMRLVSVGNMLRIAGTDGSRTVVYNGRKDDTGHMASMHSWPADQGGATMWATAKGNGTAGYMAGNNFVVEENNGGFTNMDVPFTLGDVVAATTQRVYALTTDGRVMSAPVANSVNGQWTAEEAGDDDSFASFPTQGLASATLPLSTNSDSRQIVVAGHNAGDKYCTVWSKIEEDGEDSGQQWMRYPEEDYNSHRLPVFDSMQMAAYNGHLLAFGQNSGEQPKLYASYDKGLTWQADTVATLPVGFRVDGPVAFAVDNDNFVWMVCTGNGNVWRGRQNFLGWAKREDVFSDKNF